MCPLPTRDVPGDCGLPFFGPIKDRLAYYYGRGGAAEYFKSRIQKYNSTVFRCNMPPGPFLAKNPRVVCLLDAVSFPVLFDNSKVEKKDVLDGTFVPSTAFTGGYRACAYLDPTESKHKMLKGWVLSIVAKKHETFVPLFRQTTAEMLDAMEEKLEKEGSASFNEFGDSASFEFVFRLLCGKSPSEVGNLGKKGSKVTDLWLFFQLAPLMTLGLKFLPNFVEDLLLHTFPLPFFVVKSNYGKLYAAFSELAKPILDEAEELGLSRDEACHNLVFLAGFNAYGGMKTLFPAILKWIVSGGEELHCRLRDEIRSAVAKHGGLTMASIDEMKLTKSVVYESLRLNPPVPFQYAKARFDFTIESHENTFEIKKGEMLFGYQPIVTRDPKVFDRAEEFVADRFVGEAGEKLIKYVFWSNGRESETPSVENKHCPGKDLVVALSRLLVVEWFLRYDTFEAETGALLLGSSVKITSLTKSTAGKSDC